MTWEEAKAQYDCENVHRLRVPDVSPATIKAIAMTEEEVEKALQEDDAKFARTGES